MEDASNLTSSESPTSLPRQRPVRWWQRLPLSNLQIILILLIIVGIRLAFDVSQRIIEGQQKIAEQRILEGRITDLKREHIQLEADKAYYSSPTYIEAWAHDEGKMVRDGEKLVVPVYQGKPQPRRPIVTTPPPEPLPGWAIWWTLFFDSAPPLPPSAQDGQ